jgi:hypothetical protein
MQKLVLGVVASGLLMVAVPSFAQDIGVSIGERGVRVYDRDRDYRRDRRIYTDGRRHRSDCVVTTRKHRPDGTVVIRKVNRC